MTQTFKEYLEEETTSGDIATVDNKLDLVKRKKKKEKDGKDRTTSEPK